MQCGFTKISRLSLTSRHSICLPHIFPHLSFSWISTHTSFREPLIIVGVDFCDIFGVCLRVSVVFISSCFGHFFVFALILLYSNFSSNCKYSTKFPSLRSFNIVQVNPKTCLFRPFLDCIACTGVLRFSLHFSTLLILRLFRLILFFQVF